MDAHDEAIVELAALRGISAETVRAVVAAVQEQAGAAWFYVFWMGGVGGTGGGHKPDRQRTLLAFATPDAALTFAQRNRLTAEARPRVRRLALAQLVLAMVREPTIIALRLVQAEEPPAAGQMPDGVLIARAAVLERLSE